MFIDDDDVLDLSHAHKILFDNVESQGLNSQDVIATGVEQFVKKVQETEEAEEGDFLKVMIWSEALRKEMVLPLDKSFRFDLQFGRRVLGKLLGLEARTHWKDCTQTQAEEQADAEAFKEAFKTFDFSLE